MAVPGVGSKHEMFSARVVLKSLSTLLLALCPCSLWLLSCPSPQALAPSPLAPWDVPRLRTLCAWCRDSSEGVGACPKGGTGLLLGSCFKTPGLTVSAQLLAELEGASRLRRCHG